MSTNNSFGFGSKPRMKEVPAGTEAIFSFNGEPKEVDTDYGVKLEFPITLYSHDSHPLLNDGPMEMVWQSKCQSAKQLFKALLNKEDKEFHKLLTKAYHNHKWQLTRFDTGAYYIDSTGEEL